MPRSEDCVAPRACHCAVCGGNHPRHGTVSGHHEVCHPIAAIARLRGVHLESAARVRQHDRAHRRTRVPPAVSISSCRNSGGEPSTLFSCCRARRCPHDCWPCVREQPLVPTILGVAPGVIAAREPVKRSDRPSSGAELSPVLRVTSNERSTIESVHLLLTQPIGVDPPTKSARLIAISPNLTGTPWTSPCEGRATVNAANPNQPPHHTTPRNRTSNTFVAHAVTTV